MPAFSLVAHSANRSQIPGSIWRPPNMRSEIPEAPEVGIIDPRLTQLSAREATHFPPQPFALANEYTTTKPHPPPQATSSVEASYLTPALPPALRPSPTFSASPPNSLKNKYLSLTELDS